MGKLRAAGTRSSHQRLLGRSWIDAGLTISDSYGAYHCAQRHSDRKTRQAALIKRCVDVRRDVRVPEPQDDDDGYCEYDAPPAYGSGEQRATRDYGCAEKVTMKPLCPLHAPPPHHTATYKEEPGPDKQLRRPMLAPRCTAKSAAAASSPLRRLRAPTALDEKQTRFSSVRETRGAFSTQDETKTTRYRTSLDITRNLRRAPGLVADNGDVKQPQQRAAITVGYEEDESDEDEDPAAPRGATEEFEGDVWYCEPEEEEDSESEEE
ncbi:hypothetical protein FN846DRAFT_894517 [Sphaerosporella brunnea]|uniref:Uncharacterized protein n=1 Tax=Sphaerosporella brunnea TaxID=1250544 RepID=A0A5J5EJ17_9PEZI|nr:hypothetical protein FN846DRAFT_894517 [Sphaerosporella brunnea]